MGSILSKLLGMALAFLLIVAAGCEDKGSYIPEPADEMAPDPVRDLVATSSADSTVTLEWHAPADNPGPGAATRYEIRYQIGEQTCAWWTQATPIVELHSDVPYAGVGESVTIPGLIPGQRYYFAIKAGDEVPNWSEKSNVVEVLVGPVTPPDVAGRWAGIAYDMMPDFEPWCGLYFDLSQSGHILTGTYKLCGRRGELHSGSSVGTELVVVVRYDDMDADYVFTGTIEEDLIDGTYWLQRISTGEVILPRRWYAIRLGHVTGGP